MDCALAKTTFVRKFTREQIEIFCSSEGFSTSENYTKSELYDRCCENKTIKPFKLPKEEVIDQRKLERKEVIDQWKRERKEWDRMERERVKQEEMEFQMRKEKFDSDLTTIKPTNIKKIVMVEDYSKRKRKTRKAIGAFQSVGEWIAAMAGDQPDDDVRRLPCPENVINMSREFERGTRLSILNSSILEDNVLKRLENDHENAVIVNRGSHEFIVVKPDKSYESLEKVKDDLSKQYKVKKCFDMVKSTSGDIYGVFLKK